MPLWRREFDGYFGGSLATAIHFTTLPAGLTNSDGTAIDITQSGNIVTGVRHDTSAKVFTLTVAADGTYTFDQSAALHHPAAATDNDGLGFAFTITDGDGDVSNAATITVNVRDDVPTAANVSAATEENTPITVDLNGHLAFGADGAGAPAIALGAATVTGAPEGVMLGLPDILLNSDGHTVTVTPGTAFDALAAEQQVTLHIPFTATDGDGDTVTKDIAITITGRNDAATFGGADTGAVVEAGGVANATLGMSTTGGTLAVADVDSSNAVVAQSNVVTTYGHFTIDTAGVWSYALDNGNATVEALNTGSAALHDLITVTTADGTTHQIDVSITGSNDAATFSGADTGAVVEAGGVANTTPGTPSTGGTLAVADVDSSNAVMAQSNAVTAYGHFTIDAAGVWSYALDNGNATVEALNTGSAALHDLITVTTADGTTHQIDVSINGSNDAATFSGADTGAVVEAGGVANATPETPSTGGMLAIADVDSSNAVMAQSNAVTAYGHFTIDAAGVWSYALDNGNATVQALSTGSPALHDLITVTTADGTTHQIKVTITGSNDAAVVSGTTTGSVIEAGGVNSAIAGHADRDRNADRYRRRQPGQHLPGGDRRRASHHLRHLHGRCLRALDLQYRQQQRHGAGAGRQRPA